MYAFLSGLPAILGILGFVIFLILRRFGKADQTTIAIVNRLRVDHPGRFHNARLNARQLYEVITKDQQLQKEVDHREFALLGQALRQQHVRAIVVYGICAFLFLIGASLFTYSSSRAEALRISGIDLQDKDVSSGGLLVDLDPLAITWRASGVPQSVAVYIENLDSGAISRKLDARSSDGEVDISPMDYAGLRFRKGQGEYNRVRVIIQADKRAFSSGEFKLYVGISLIAAVSRSKVIIGATIDGELIQGYHFEAVLNVPEKHELHYLLLDKHITGVGTFHIKDEKKYNWSNARLKYIGPDGRLVRCKILYN